MSTWKNFDIDEFACSHCGKNEIDPKVIDLAQKIRDQFGKPMAVTSGYRCPDHPAEKSKMQPGTHARGIAVDVAVSHKDARELTRIILDLDVGGVGINQKGSGRFVHFDLDPTRRQLFWTY